MSDEGRLLRIGMDAEEDEARDMVASNQQLTENLVTERIKSEQHRLNYERLRCLYDKLQQDMETQERVGVVKSNKDVGSQSDPDLSKLDVTSGPFAQEAFAATRDPSPALQPTRLQSPSLDHIHGLKHHLIKRPASLTDLTGDDRMLDLIPGITPPVPHNEILRQCNRWKELYLNLLDEFQQYKYNTDALLMNNDDILNEKVREGIQGLEQIRMEKEAELQKLEHKLDGMIRERSVLETEIKAIREQLAETNGKLEEKTTLAQALQRQIDEHTMGTSLEKRCDLPQHVEIERKLSAAETRLEFLQEELGQMSDKNVLLQDKILSIIQQSSKEITTLRKALSGKEETAHKERVELQSQHEEAIQHLQIQQAYIEDLDKFVNERMEENQEVSKQVQDFASKVAQETEQTLEMLEDRLKSALDEKVKLEDALLRASKVIRELTEEARRQRVTASRFITHIYQVLSIPPGDSGNEVSQLRTLPYNVLLSDNIINSIDEDSDMAHTYAIDTKIHMKELLKRVIFWSRQFELQKERLRERVAQLEQFQAEAKKGALEEVERYRKKCTFYRDVLRQLRQHLGAQVVDESLRKILPTRIYEQAGNWLNKSRKGSQEENIHRLLHGSSSDKLVEAEQKAEVPTSPPPPPPPPTTLPTAIPAQSKFGPASTLNPPRPFVSANLQNYLKKHERFVHILDSVQKYVPNPSGDDEDLEEILRTENS